MISTFQNDPARYGAIRLSDGKPVKSYSRMVAYAAELHGISEATLYRWIAAYKKHGMTALADKPRKDKSQSRWFREHPRAQYLAAYLYLECKASITVCHESILRDAALLEIPADDLPSYGTVRRWLDSMPPSLTVYAREGAKIYRERMAPYLKRGITDVYAGAVWIGDHMIHDVECSNDCFDNVEYGAPVRIRLSSFIDYRSRMVMGATWCWEGSSRAIAACLRRGIAKYGPPEHLYQDNGKDYRKVAKGAQRSCAIESSSASGPAWKQAELDAIAASGFLTKLGIAVTSCLPYHPQSKAIERFHGTLHERFDSVWPTYTTGTPFTRPESTELAMMSHRRLLKAGRVAESKHPLASRFILACLAWMEEYADTPHSGEGMEGQTPRQVFEANRNPEQKPAPDYATLALLMAEHEARQVRECAITLAKHRYVPIDAAGWGALHEQNEREIVVAYDSADLDAVAALDKDGNFLAWLQSEQLVKFAPWEPETQAQIAESMAMRRRLEKGNRETIALVTRAARANGAQSPLEAMATRLQLSDGETGKDIVTQRNPKLSSPHDTHELPARPMTPVEVARLCIQELSK